MDSLRRNSSILVERGIWHILPTMPSRLHQAKERVQLQGTGIAIVVELIIKKLLPKSRRILSWTISILLQVS